MNGWMMGGWMDEWMDGWMDGWWVTDDGGWVWMDGADVLKEGMSKYVHTKADTASSPHLSFLAFLSLRSRTASWAH